MQEADAFSDPKFIQILRFASKGRFESTGAKLNWERNHLTIYCFP